MKKVLALSLMTLFLFNSCKKQENDVENKINIIKNKDPFADDRIVIQSDLIKEAKNHALTTLALSEPNFDFGKIKKGDEVEHTYEITNTGKNPLIISSVHPTCGCTVPEYTKEPILPNQKGKITLKFNSGNFEGIVHKAAEVYANVEQVPLEIRFTADIEP